MTTESKLKRIIITRPDAQASAWATDLSAHGFTTVRLNLLDIRAVSDTHHLQAIKNKILDFDLYQKAIFVSQNAVQHGMEWLENYWPQLPTGVDFFAVGATTANKLASYGVNVEDLAVTTSGAMTSETLLHAPQLQQIEGEKILIFRGLGGRGHLADELRMRGAKVDYCELYERVLPDTALEQLHTLLNNAQTWHNEPTIISLHSGESLQNLLLVMRRLQAAGKLPSSASELLLATPVLVPSQRIADNANAAGFTHCILAENATDDAMTSSLLNYCRVN